jgi:hypothetical protein
MPEFEVLDHKKLDPKKAPYIIVTSASSDRMFSTSNRPAAIFVFTINLLVPYSAVEVGWTPDKAEDLLDDMEERVAECVVINQNTDMWYALKNTVPSVIDEIEISGATLLHESLIVRMEVSSVQKSLPS